FMLLTILSGLFGGLLRLAPELLKFLDAKNDRAHELAMQDKALEFQKLTGTQKIAEINQTVTGDIEKSRFDALSAAYASQATMASDGGKWVSFVSALVRPAVTFFVFAMWASFKIAVLAYTWHQQGNLVDTM